MTKILYWFKNNLRLKDNPSLLAALEKGEQVYLCYVLDERLTGKHKLGFENMGPYRKKFLFESIAGLASDIKDRGGDLIFRVGNPPREILKLCEELSVDEVITSLDPGDYERTWDEEVSAQTRLTAIDDQSLYLMGDLPFGYPELPMSFTAFRKKVEKKSKVREESPAPEDLSFTRYPGPSEIPVIPDILTDRRSAFPYGGGEQAAWRRTENYIWIRQRIKSYKKTRNGLIGTEYSSKFSPWLSLGNISPVSLYQQIRRYEKEVVSNESTYWLYFEIMWRDYFRHVGFKFREKIFHLEGIREMPTSLKRDKDIFIQWIKGNTDDPFVNANMKELATTGFMSNRGRQNAASYLIHDLGIDWRWGAAYFESMLIDYDTCSNWGNWMYIAGVGNSRQPQVFDTQRQAWMYDRQGKYVSLWNN